MSVQNAELEAKIKKYQAEIFELQAIITEHENSTDVFRRIDVVEAKSKIKDYTERCQRLANRIAGVDEDSGPTDEQLKLIEYVLSPAYDND